MIPRRKKNKDVKPADDWTPFEAPVIQPFASRTPPASGTSRDTKTNRLLAMNVGNVRLHNPADDQFRPSGTYEKPCRKTTRKLGGRSRSNNEG